MGTCTGLPGKASRPSYSLSFLESLTLNGGMATPFVKASYCAVVSGEPLPGGYRPINSE